LSRYKNTLIGFAAFAFAAIASVGAFAADAARGQSIYEEQGCVACHGAKEALVGPPHCGVFDRKAGSVEGFMYSDAMKESGIVWDEKNLHEFLSSPLTFVSGTMMGYAGLAEEKDRADLIEFLKTQRAADSAACK
jgi:cytochrome c